MLRVLEISWLLVVLFGTSFGVYKIFSETFVDSISIFLITIIAAIFYIVRRKQRIAMQKEKEE
jgi:drug/metabolite transporter (DMT)-like permease